jgi:hypothetical protein
LINEDDHGNEKNIARRTLITHDTKVCKKHQSKKDVQEQKEGYGQHQASKQAQGEETKLTNGRQCRKAVEAISSPHISLFYSPVRPYQPTYCIFFLSQCGQATTFDFTRSIPVSNNLQQRKLQQRPHTAPAATARPTAK